ncbi:MAG: ABC transporter permease [Acidobacteriota bacterium]
MQTQVSRETVIRPGSGWRLIDWRELLAYRDLFFFLVLRDIKVLYKQTALGFSWAIIRPVFSTLVFSVVFGGLASVPSDGVPYPLFSFAAILPWIYFSTAMTKSTASLVQNASMLSKVYFPRLVIPMTPVLAGLVDFAIGGVILAGLMAWYGVIPTPAVLGLPFLMLLMMLTAAGIGMWLSALAIQYRDVNHAMPFVAQLLIYAAPVVWPVSLINERFPESADLLRWIYGLYPMAGVIEGFRAALLGTGPMPWDLLISGTAVAVALAVSGAFYFRRTERIFADVA